MSARDVWRELVRLERADRRLFGRIKLPGDKNFRPQPGRFERVERARAAVRARIAALEVGR